MKKVEIRNRILFLGKLTDYEQTDHWSISGLDHTVVPFYFSKDEIDLICTAEQPAKLTQIKME